MKCSSCGYDFYSLYLGRCPTCGSFLPEECLKQAFSALEMIALNQGCSVDYLLASVGKTPSEIGYGSNHAFFKPSGKA